MQQPVPLCQAMSRLLDGQAGCTSRPRHAVHMCLVPASGAGGCGAGGAHSGSRSAAHTLQRATSLHGLHAAARQSSSGMRAALAAVQTHHAHACIALSPTGPCLPPITRCVIAIPPSDRPRAPPACLPVPARGAEGDPNNVGHVITTAGGSGASKQVIRYLTERVVGNGSFGVVFQAKCIETSETVRRRAAGPPAPPRLRSCCMWGLAGWECGACGHGQLPALGRQRCCWCGGARLLPHHCPGGRLPVSLPVASHLPAPPPPLPRPAGGHQEGAAGQAVQEPRAADHPHDEPPQHRAAQALLLHHHREGRGGVGWWAGAGAGQVLDWAGGRKGACGSRRWGRHAERRAGRSGWVRGATRRGRAGA